MILLSNAIMMDFKRCSFALMFSINPNGDGKVCTNRFFDYAWARSTLVSKSDLKLQRQNVKQWASRRVVTSGTSSVRAVPRTLRRQVPSLSPALLHTNKLQWSPG